MWAEYLSARFAPDNAIPMTVFRPEGWYILATFSPVPDRLEAVARFEQFDQHRGNGPAAIGSVFVGANYYLSRNHDLKLQGGHMISRHAGEDDTLHRLLLRAQLMFSVL